VALQADTAQPADAAKRFLIEHIKRTPEYKKVPQGQRCTDWVGNSG
jgi:hypothetical protein